MKLKKRIRGWFKQRRRAKRIDFYRIVKVERQKSNRYKVRGERIAMRYEKAELEKQRLLDEKEATRCAKIGQSIGMKLMIQGVR